MKKILLALGLCLLSSIASAQCTGVFAAGRVCGSVAGGVAQPVAITSFPPFASASANTVFAGPTSGGAAAPAFRSLVGADLPLPTAITLGAVFSKTPTASNWLRSLGTDGIFTISQPAFTDISGSATLAQLPTEGADTVLGNFSGGTAVPNTTSMPNCTGALNYSTSTHTFSCNTSSVPSAPDQVANCSLAASVSGGALTISLKDQTGADPSAPSPCTVAFRNSTIATGIYTSVSVTSALSFSTAVSGSTFGSTNSVPFRLWITAWNNAGTLVLGVSSHSTSTAIFPLNEGNVQSSTACSACGTATAAGTFYTTAAQSSKAIRILGYMDWASGLATAGTYASGPTTIQMFGQGIYKPGQEVQRVYATSATATTGTGVTPKATVPSASITPTATTNLIDASASGGITQNTSAGYAVAQLYRAAGASAVCTTAFGSKTVNGIGAGNLVGSVTVNGLDAPGTVSQQTYTVCITNTTANNPAWCDTAIATQNCSITVKEIMG